MRQIDNSSSRFGVFLVWCVDTVSLQMNTHLDATSLFLAWYSLTKREEHRGFLRLALLMYFMYSSTVKIYSDVSAVLLSVLFSQNQ